MKRLHYLGFLLLWGVIFIASDSLAAGGEKPPLYTNDDIEKYRSSSDRKVEEPQRQAPQPVREERSLRSRQDQEHWCRQATQLKRKIEKARHDLKEAEEAAPREQTKRQRTQKKTANAEAKLKKAKDRLFHAEQDLNDLESEAHRKSVPPGWLRCQFD